jgi:trans-aconitate 2-methyltransferase
MMVWDPKTYLRYNAERTQAARDLVSRIQLVKPMRILDLGCGPGNSTQVLKESYPEAMVEGIDSSDEMLAKAKEDFPKGTWTLGDVRKLEYPNRFDILFSNAVIHWIPNHEEVMKHWMDFINPKGALAIQVPSNHHSPIMTEIYKMSKELKWKEYFHDTVDPLFYKEARDIYPFVSTLSSLFTIWETTYFYPMKSHKEIITWYRGAGLRPYLQAIPNDPTKEEFENELLERITPSYPIESNKMILFPFKRLFIILNKI